MVADEHRFARRAEVVAVLADPALVPVRPPADAPAEEQVSGTAAWLRARVARFAHGPAHARRRAFVEAEIARIDDERLRRAALETAREAGTGADPRFVAVQALAQALALPDPAAVAADVALVSGVYFGGSDPAASGALVRLIAVYREAAAEANEDQDDEEIANRISVLIQAFDATGRLVGQARHAAEAAAPAAPADIATLLLDTLRHDPPVLVMRRVAARTTTVAGVEVTAGDLVTLDIAAASADPELFDSGSSPLTYGSEPRRCPGMRQSLIVAAAILEVLDA